MKRGSKKRKRLNEEDVPITSGQEEGVSSDSADGPSELSSALSMLQPELQLLIQKFSLQKPMSMVEMRRLLGLLIAEFNQYVPMLKESSKKVGQVEQLEKANKDLIDQNNTLLEDKAATGKEICILKQQISRSQPPSIVIKNLPLHRDAVDSNESKSQSVVQFRKFLASVNLPNLEFKSVYRWKSHTETTPARPPVMQAELVTHESRKILMKKLYLLRNCSEFSKTSVQTLFPKHLHKELKEKESLSYFLRRELNTKTKILMKQGTLFIHFLCYGQWMIYDETQPINNQQPAIFNNACWPKRVKTKF